MDSPTPSSSPDQLMRGSSGPDSPQSTNSDDGGDRAGGVIYEKTPPTTRSQAAAAQNGSFADRSGSSRPAVEGSFLQGESRIEIGEEHQAVVPPYNPMRCLEDYLLDEDRDRRQSVCVWSPPEQSSHDISEANIVSFCELARQRHRFNVEQSLGILKFAEFDFDQAVRSLDEYRSIPEEWSKSDKILFEQAFAFNGKMFRRIKQMIPDKTMGDVVEYYYLWKKKRQRCISYAEQVYKKRKATWVEDFDDMDLTQAQERETSKRPQLQPCSNCRAPYAQLQPSDEGMLCGTCFLYWRRTGQLRTTNGASSAAKTVENRERMIDAPDEMTVNVIDFIDAAPRSTNPGEIDAVARKRQEQLKKINIELEDLRREAQVIKTNSEKLGFNPSMKNGQHRNFYNIAHLRKAQPKSKGKVTSNWAAYENLLVIQGFRRFGLDFAAIADVLETKTESHVKKFYETYKDQYQLDKVRDLSDVEWFDYFFCDDPEVD